MKNLALIAFCFFSSFAVANDVEEVTVTAMRIKVVLQKLAETHVQNPTTGDWYYVEKKIEKSKA